MSKDLIRSTLASLYAQAQEQFGIAKAQEVAVLLAASQVLHEKGVESRVAVRDFTFDDSDHECTRAFALEVDGRQYDVHGNEGWDDIVLAGLTEDQQERELTVVEEDDSVLQVAIERAANAAIDPQWHALVSHVHAQTLDALTQDAPRPHRRIGL